MPLIKHRRNKHSKVLLQLSKLVRANAAKILNSQNRASLYCLPPELIYEICDYLCITDIFCLTICCTRFWNFRNAISSLNRVQRLIHSPPPDRVREISEVRFHILYLLESDRMLDKGIKSFCCWACTCSHPKAAFDPRKPVKRATLSLLLGGQSINFSPALIRNCKSTSRKILVGFCHELSYTTLRIVFHEMVNRGKIQIAVPDPSLPFEAAKLTLFANRYFSERVELELDRTTNCNWIISNYSIGLLNNLGIDGVFKVLRRARLPMCPHRDIYTVVRRLQSSYGTANVTCSRCLTYFFIDIPMNSGHVKVHIRQPVGLLGPVMPSEFRKSSYANGYPYKDRCQQFADWMDRMYNHDTGAGHNDRKFAMFTVRKR